MSRAVPTSPFARYPRLYARVEGMTQEEARMVVVTIIKTMPTLLREGYQGYKSARTRVIEAIQIRDWNQIYNITERYLEGEQGWCEVYDLVVSDSEDEDSDFEEEADDEDESEEEADDEDESEEEADDEDESEEEADDEDESEDEYEYDYEYENEYGDYTHGYYYDDDGETVQTIAGVEEPQLKKEHLW